ncbi:hypothetical protein [Carnobacterium inhibens]|uniref:hypothetical protein n=1 Tax=Carnobacterium inhibens TaxID=147709 RepID=UPI000550C96D|nr:hypothetical protein [Carnobacterium inhibens]
MDYNDYLNSISERFSNMEEIKIGESLVTVSYEEKFKIQWVATKLKIFSFIHYIDKIDIDTIENYSSVCTKYASKKHKGLPRGLQNGVVSFNVLVSEFVTDEAIEFVTSRPKKHFSLFETPIIYDVSRSKLYYYEGTPIWGSMYNNYLRSYIEDHFNL